MAQNLIWHKTEDAVLLTFDNKEVAVMTTTSSAASVYLWEFSYAKCARFGWVSSRNYIIVP